jgi:hypothetical protein
MVSGLDLPDLGVVAGRQCSHPPGVAGAVVGGQKQSVGAGVLGAEAALVELDVAPGWNDPEHVAARPARPRSVPGLVEA